jgi:hypothetical protein
LTHPPDDALLAEPRTPAIEEHLRACPECRIVVRLHQAACEPGSAPGLEESRPTLTAWREASLADLGEELGTARHALRRGRRLGPWRVEARIGAGATAVVYRVRHTDGPGVAALKVADTASEALQARVAREVAALRKLSHPNVVGVLDVLEVDGRPGLLLELVPGPTLAEVLAADVLPLQVRLALGLDLLEGVAAAHAHGLVHRDLKPGNILVDPRGGRLVARVADFGLVKLDPAEAHRLTRTGAVLGTPAYMAPEQIRDSASIDARADVFSLGAILFELLTGVRAFAGRTVLEIFDRIRSGDRPAVRDLVPDLPEPLVRAVDSALRPEPQDRQPTVEGLRALWLEGGARAGVADEEAVEAVARLVQARPVHHLEASGPPQGPGSAAALVGRDVLVAQIVARAHAPGWLTLVGPPGVGTTALALEVGAQLGPYLPGGVIFVWLSSARSPEEVLDAVLAAMGLPLRDPADLGASLAAHGPMLLVLDHLDPRALGELGQTLRAPELRVLATAQRPLEVHGEQLIAVPPLSSSASRLLWAELSRARADEAQIEAILAICAGLPLAIRTAAGCAAEVVAGPEPLEACARAARRALSAGAVRAWEAAALFRGGFVVEALAAVLGADELEAEDLLDELVDVGVVHSAGETGAPRFWLADGLRPSSVPEEAADRLVAWCSELEPERASAERAQLQVAVERATATGDPEAVRRCGRLLLAAMWDAGVEGAARALSERLGLPLPEADGPRRARSGRLRREALLLLEAGDLPRARARAHEALLEARVRVLPSDEAEARAILARM